MTEILEQASTHDEETQGTSEHSQYQHQTFTLHNTLGLVFMSVMAFALLVGLLRQQSRYHELVKQLEQHMS